MNNAPASNAAATGSPHAASSRGPALRYAGLLILLVAFCDPNEGLIAIPLEFLLKNKLQFDPYELSVFRLVAAIPLYFSFVFGFARDTTNPFGLGDRGFLILFGALSALLYLTFAFASMSVFSIMIAVFVLTIAFLFIDSAKYGMTSIIAREQSVSGQVSVLWSALTALPTIAALVIGGALSDLLERADTDTSLRALFLLAAGLLCALAVFGLWKPSSVRRDVRHRYAQVSAERQALRKFATHWPIYPALAIWLLFKFAPGMSTPLQYYLQNSLAAADHLWGEWNAVFYAVRIPVYIAYAFLCRHFTLRTLLWIGTLLTIPQFLPLLFVDSIPSALVAAAAIGALGAIANAAYLDLIIRACPAGLQGTTIMMASALYYVANRFGDLLGIFLYQSGGFAACVIAITATYSLILLLLRLVPRDLTDHTDGAHTPA